MRRKKPSTRKQATLKSPAKGTGGEGRVVPLRTAQQLIEASEWMFNKQRRGELDGKAADAMNTTLKNQRYIVIEIPMAALKISVQAAKSKLRIDPEIFTRLGIISPLMSTPIEEGPALREAVKALRAAGEDA